MTLLSELDYKQTRDNARDVLKSCRSLQRRSGVVVALESPVLSDMPRHHSNRNNTEHSMIKSLELVNKGYINMLADERKKLQAIVSALKSLSDVSQSILYYSYCVANPSSTIKLSRMIKVYREDELGNLEVLHYSVKNIEKLKASALIEFAEAYHYENLLAFKK